MYKMSFKLEIKKYLQFPLQDTLSIHFKSIFIQTSLTVNLNTP